MFSLPSIFDNAASFMRFGPGNRSITTSPQLTALTLSANTIAENSGSGTFVAAVLSATAGSTLSIVDTAGGRFALSGATIVAGSTPTNFEAAQSHSVTIRETRAGSANSPRDTTFTINVTNVFEQPSLNALSIPEPVLRGSTIPISGSTAGSSITANTLPNGWTLNGAARNIVIAADAAAGNWSLTETLADSANSPRVSTGSSTLVIAPVNTALPVITQTGSVLSVTPGTWTGTAATYSYQWSRNGTNVGAPSSTPNYSIPPQDLNALFGCIVTATNAAGNASATAALLYVGLLDVLSVQSAASFTLRRLRRDQGANLNRVRRSTDQAETNIGFATVAQTRTNLDRVPAADGDSRTSAGIAITVVGTGTEFGQSYIDIRWNGTATAAVNLRYCSTILTASPNATTNALVTPGQTYTCSMGYRLVAGTWPAVTARLTQFYRNGTALVGEANNSLPTAPNAALQRSAVIGAAPSTANYVQNILQMDGASGIVVDFTMRFYAPNTELGTGNARPLLQRYVAETVAAVGDLDATALLNFAGSASAFTSNWYDQAGASYENLLVRSENVDQSPWPVDNGGAFNPIITPDFALAPNGTMTADRVQLNKTGGTFSRLQQNVTRASDTYTYSVYLKNNGVGVANVGIRVGAGAGVNCVLTTEWQRFSVTTTVPNPGCQILLFDSIAGNDETADILVWGNQLNAGATAQPYQQTTDSPSNARNATQATPASQPMIVNAGAINTRNGRASNFFNGSQWLGSNAPLPITQAFSVMASTGLPSTGTEYATGGASGLIALRVVATEQRRVGISGSNIDFTDPLSVDVLRQYTDTANPSTMRRNGIDALAGLTSISTAGVNMTIGARDGAIPMLGHESEQLFFNPSLTPAERQIVERNQGAYFGITIA